MTTKKITLTKAKKKAWTEFSRFIRIRDSLKTVGNTKQCACITCGKICPTLGRSSIHAGHFIPGRKNGVLFHEDLVHGQCGVCNMWKKGDWVTYEQKMVEMYGRDKVEEYKLLAFQTVKYTVEDLQEIEAKYKKKADSLLNS
jgi:hypothetical protein